MDCFDQYSINHGIFFNIFWRNISNSLMIGMIYFLGTVSTSIILTSINTSAKIGEKKKKNCILTISLSKQKEKKKKKVCNVSAPKKLRERVGGINFFSFKLFKSCTLGAKIGRCRKIKFYQINSLFFFFPSSFTYIWHLYYHNPNSFFYLSLLFYFGNGVCTIQFFFSYFQSWRRKIGLQQF